MKSFVLRRLKGIRKTTLRFSERLADILENQQGNALSWILGIVFVLVVFAFIVLPQGHAFFDSMFEKLTNYANTLPIFPNS